MTDKTGSEVTCRVEKQAEPAEPASDLDYLRKQINLLDEQLTQLFTERMRICSKIATYKRTHGLNIEAPERETDIISVRGDATSEFRDETIKFFKTIFSISKRCQRSKLNLYLIGMPDCGKTRIGRRLSMLLGRPFADTDDMVVQRTQMSVDALFDCYGEPIFRKFEHMALLEIAERGGHIVATGGGILTQPDNIDLLKYSGKLVFLDRKLKYLLEANTAGRPLLRDGKEAVLRLYGERINTYKALADLILDPDTESAYETICKFYKAQICDE